MEKDILISVIIPTYNAENHLDRAVQSVLCQMDGSIELILVNDGSTDGTGAMCNAYAAAHAQVRVIHKENGGTSSAKNMGIATAKGQYISFIDSDDYIDPAAYGQVSQALLECQPDCLDFGWNYIDSEGNLHPNHHGLKKNTLLSRQVLDETILPPLLNLRDDKPNFIFDFACNKIFKAEIIRTFGVHFDEDKRTWEDRTFLLRHLKHCETYYSMDQCFYHYVWTPNSLSQRYSLDIFNIILANFRHYRELFDDRFDFDTEYAINYRCQSIENMIFHSFAQKENCEKIRENIVTVLKDPGVVYWYEHRISDNPKDHEVSIWVATGQYNKILRYYEQQLRNHRREKAQKRILNSLKNRIKNVLGKN